MDKVESIIDFLVLKDTEKYIVACKFMEFMMREEIASVIDYLFRQKIHKLFKNLEYIFE